MTKNGLKLVGVASALTLSLAACGGDEDFDTPGGSSPTQTQDADQPEPTDTPSESDPSDSDDTSNGEADNGGEATSSEIDLASDELPVTAQDALDISADEVGGGDSAIVHAIEIEYSKSGDMWEWSVKTLVDGTDHKVKINADTGDVTKHEEDSTDDHEEAINLDDPMPFSEAKDIALDARDGRIISWKYEWDDNRYEYEFDIESDGNTYEVNVNAENGDVRVDD